MASASPVTDYEWVLSRPGGGRVVATQPHGQTVVTIDRSQESPVPAGARLLSSFLDEFEAQDDIAELLPAVRQEIGQQYAEAAGATLRELRLMAGLSQVELARQLGTSQARISRLEARKEKPAEEVIRALCAALAVDPNTLFEALARADK